MNHLIVHCEFRGQRRSAVEIPVSVETTVRDGVDCTRMVACEIAERSAQDSFGGSLSDWFAWKVEEDKE